MCYISRRQIILMLQAYASLIIIERVSGSGGYFRHPYLLSSSNNHDLRLKSIMCRGGGDLDVAPIDLNGNSEDNVDVDDISIATNEMNDSLDTDIDEDDDEISEDVAQKSSAQTKPPVKLIIKTGLNSKLVDQSLELMASRTRDVASLKLSCYRQMRGRPPTALQTLRLGMMELDDSMTIDDILDDEEDDDEEDDEEDRDEPDLVLTLDMAPPVDPKFGTELGGNMLKTQTTEELIDAYAANQASLMGVNKWISEAATKEADKLIEDKGDDEIIPPSTESSLESETLWMRKQALLVKEQMLSKMSEEALSLLDKIDEEEESSDALLASSIRRRSQHGGAKMNMKRMLQRNLNIDWNLTIRNFILFLFFGFFGAQDTLSRTLMYLGAPMCFIIQARPIKIIIKQLFYSMRNPPGILLSLLPAPQQKIMDLNFESAMEEIYGSSSPRSLTDDIVDDEVDSEDYDEYDEDEF